MSASMKKPKRESANDRIAVIVAAVHQILKRKTSRNETLALTNYIAAKMPRAKRARLAKSFDPTATKHTISTVLRIAEAASHPN